MSYIYTSMESGFGVMIGENELKMPEVWNKLLFTFINKSYLIQQFLCIVFFKSWLILRLYIHLIYF